MKVGRRRNREAEVEDSGPAASSVMAMLAQKSQTFYDEEAANRNYVDWDDFAEERFAIFPLDGEIVSKQSEENASWIFNSYTPSEIIVFNRDGTVHKHLVSIDGIGPKLPSSSVLNKDLELATARDAFAYAGNHVFVPEGVNKQGKKYNAFHKFKVDFCGPTGLYAKAFEAATKK